MPLALSPITIRNYKMNEEVKYAGFWSRLLATAIDTQEIGTQVLVNNGETIVLGGIYQQQVINSVSKVPVLGDIPYVGWLFRTTTEFNEKKELLIFVTPRIVTEKF
mgnify:CR=1 FL=1